MNVINFLLVEVPNTPVMITSIRNSVSLIRERVVSSVNRVNCDYFYHHHTKWDLFVWSLYFSISLAE